MEEMQVVNWAQIHLRAIKVSVFGRKSGLQRIPAIRKLRIKLGKWHPMLRMIGLNHRTPNHMEFEQLGTHQAQRYMKYQLTRLLKVRKNPKIYWTIVKYLMLKSVVFRTSVINHVFLN